MEYDWSPLMGRSGETVEGLRCCTMGSGAQFVMTLGLSVMPELLAGQSDFIYSILQDLVYNVESIIL